MRRLVLFVIILTFVIYSEVLAENKFIRNYDYKRMSKDLSVNLKERATELGIFPNFDDAFKKITFNLKDINTKYLVDTGIEVQPFQGIIFLGPPGSFLIGLESSKEAGVMGPTSIDPKEIERGTFQYNSFPVNYHFLLGYFFPDRKGVPLPPQNDDYVDVFILNSKLINADQNEKQRIAVNLSKEEILLLKEKIELKRLTIVTTKRNILMWLPVPLSILFIIGYYLIVKKYCFISIEEPEPKRSLWELYNDKKRSFLCLVCTNPLKIKGRFECRAGHIPPRDRFIFEGCYKCDDEFENLRCNSCGEVINLKEKNYIQEEIENRGNAYISRMNPLKKYFTLLSWPILIILLSTYWLRGLTGIENDVLKIGNQYIHLPRAIYNEIYKPGILGSPLLGDFVKVVFSLCIIWGSALLYFFTQKEIVMRNLYEKE